MYQLNKMAVVGAGTMGHGIAQVLAMAGMEVVLVDKEAQALMLAHQKISSNLKKACNLGKISPQLESAALERLRISEDMQAIRDADLIIEAVPEILELKKEVLKYVDQLAKPEAILATNTSSLSVDEIAHSTSRPQQVIGLHFFNPVHIMKLLEIIVTKQTSPDVLTCARTFASLIGKTSIVVHNSPGFATSRLGICFALEAMRMLEEGVASVEDIDTAMMLGYGHPMGPLKLTDLVGLDVRLAIAESLTTNLKNAAFAPPAILRTMVSEGKLGQKSGQGFYNWQEKKSPRATQLNESHT